jgi:UPF0755 protein
MRKSIIWSFIIIFVLVGVWIWQGIYLPLNKNSLEEKIFRVETGQGAKEIAQNLTKEGLIKSSSLFRIYASFKGEAGRLKAGVYKLSPSMSIPEIVQKLVEGKVAKIKVTIPEGFTIKEIEKKLNSKLKIQTLPADRQDSKSQFKIQNFKIANYQDEFTFLRDAPEKASLEGFLFPDTYEFSPSATPEDIVRKMLANFNRKLTPDLREAIKREGKTIFEIVTMASLIEKEVRSQKDKKLVSGILWKRLKYGIPLQVDATITYITGKKTTEILYDELSIDSPYNTYKYRGLPIGPISNPGLESIKAAVYPQESDYWYYLSAPDGTTLFSKTLKEHNLKRKKYLR